MATNIEIKARIDDLDALRARAARLSDTPVETLFQEDTFQVDGLGAFMELEVVLYPGQTAADGTITALQLMKDLRIEESQLVEGAYIDLLSGAASAVGRGNPGQH